MKKYNLSTMEGQELVPGGTARIIHSNKMTVVHWDFIAKADLPDHSHPHEQVMNLLEGELEFTLDNETEKLDAGAVVVIPPGISHSARTLTVCRVLDVFTPCREDL